MDSKLNERLTLIANLSVIVGIVFLAIERGAIRLGEQTTANRSPPGFRAEIDRIVAEVGG